MVLSLNGIFCAFNFLVKIAFPSSAINFFSSFKEDLILERALAVLAKSNQLLVGFDFSEVMISTWSPLFNS